MERWVRKLRKERRWSFMCSGDDEELYRQVLLVRGRVWEKVIVFGAISPVERVSVARRTVEWRALKCMVSG